MSRALMDLAVFPPQRNGVLLMTGAPSPVQRVGPFLAAGPKDAVSTSLGSARVWATMGQGIVSEVYWPSTGEPQIRDLGFIVAGEGWWVEVKALAQYTVAVPDPDAPVATITHTGPVEHPFRLDLEVIPDPARDALLIRYEVSGVAARVYTLLASHLQHHPETNADKDYGGGGDNVAWTAAGGPLFAQGADRYLCLAAGSGFARTSVGYFGTSDLWQDFDRNGAMTWTFTDAGPGFVVLSGELPDSSGLLALAFAEDADTAQTLADASLNAGVTTTRDALIQSWHDWAAVTQLPPAQPEDPAELTDALRRSATVLRVHEDRGYPGAIVAGLTIPWGDTTNNPGGYHLVWPRDAVETGFAFLALGHLDDAARLLTYLAGQQQVDGHWVQNFFPDGTPFWQGTQLDETALPVMLAAKLADRGYPTDPGTAAMIAAAIGFLVRNGPLTEQDRWEEDPGGSPYTLGVIVAALVAGAAYLSGPDQQYVLDLADDWNHRIEEWTYVHDSWLDSIYGASGHYVRVGPDPQTGVTRIANQADTNFDPPSSGVIGLEYLYLPRLGLRDPNDPRITDTTALVDVLLARNVGTGVAYYRYNYDGYGEQVDGGNWSGVGVGRAWPLLAGERGHGAVLVGQDGLTQLTAMLAMRSPAGLVPEQVWDQPPLVPRDGIPSLPLLTGLRTLSAMPLVWGHSELIKLAWVRVTKQPVEQLRAVTNRYHGQAPTPTVTFWRTAVPVVGLPPRCDLVVEDTQPFVLHYGHDGWKDLQDRSSAPLGFGMHGVRLTDTELDGWSSLQFRRRYPDGWDTHGDQVIRLGPQPALQLRQHSVQP